MPSQRDLRDRFAGQALAFWARQGIGGWTGDLAAEQAADIARHAYILADAMLEERRKAWPDLEGVLESILPQVIEMAEQGGYGYARPEDPRDFHPDAESCSEQEIANHRKACELWDAAGGKPDGWTPPPGSEWAALPEGGFVHILRAPWGIGSYVFRDPEMAALRDAIVAVLKPKKRGGAAVPSASE